MSLQGNMRTEREHQLKAYELYYSLGSGRSYRKVAARFRCLNQRREALGTIVWLAGAYSCAALHLLVVLVV